MNDLAEKYIVIEIFEKLSRLNNFINLNRDLAKAYGKKITLNVFEIALRKIVEQLELPIKTINNGPLTREGKFAVNRRLASTLDLYRQFHRMLRFIHTDWVRPETYTFTQRLIDYLPKEYRKTPVNIILIDEYSFKENNLVNKFNEVFSTSRLKIEKKPLQYPTIFLPKVEISNPLNWTILAHEIGHINLKEIKKLIQDVTIIPPNTTTQDIEILKKWAEEIFCDIFSINVLGPAYFASLVSYSISTGGLVGNSINSKDHPSNILRVRFLAEYIKRNGLDLSYDTPLFGQSDISTFFTDIIEDIDSINRNTLGNPLKTKVEIPDTTHFLDSIRVFSKNYSNDIKFQSSNKIPDLLTKLRRGIPIGAICEHDPNDIL